VQRKIHLLACELNRNYRTSICFPLIERQVFLMEKLKHR